MIRPHYYLLGLAFYLNIPGDIPVTDIHQENMKRYLKVSGSESGYAAISCYDSIEVQIIT
jgi:hypothetical protein